MSIFVYREIKKDLTYLIIVYFLVSLIISTLGIDTDDTDKDGFNRSGVVLVTDYKTGLQYLYRSGALIPRVDPQGKHMRIKEN